MPNVWGEDEQGNGLTNPLNEDLLANGFNALDFNEVHLNELHDNSGTGKIVVHEELNMTNNKISNLAEPTQNKDAATKQYVDNLGGSVYDFYSAFSDEDSLLVSGGNTGVKNYSPRSINLTQTDWNIIGYLSTAPTNVLQFNVILGLGTPSTLKTITFQPGNVKSDASLGQNFVGIVESTEITMEPLQSDPTATGIKLLIKGSI